MRIVKRVEFLTLPAGTLFNEYEPCVSCDLRVKGDTLHSNDFNYAPLSDVSVIKSRSSEEFFDMLFRAAETGESMETEFDCGNRDGMYDPPDRLYMVWEQADVDGLIKALEKARAQVWP